MLPIILTVLGCGGFFTLIQFLIQRYDNKKGELSQIKKELAEIRQDIKRLDDKGDRREAENKRVRILRFEDELQRGVKHSKDSFDQVVGCDITDYNQYCDSHPSFRNNQTTATVAHILKVYNDRLEKHDFA